MLTKPAIQQGRESNRYLRYRKAKGTTLSKSLIVLCPHPSKSTLFEELLHALQHETGIFSHDRTSCLTLI